MHPQLRRLVADGVPVAAETVDLPPARFRRARESVSDDSFGAGAVVHDDGRAALVSNAWSDGWVYPGGTVEPGESVREAVRREVREETGLAVTVDRPLRVVEQTFRTAGGETFDNRFALFTATPTAADPTLAADPGEAGEGISEVAWHRSVPEGIQQAAVLARFVDD